MKLPNSVKIGAFEYSINFIDNLCSDDHRFAEINHRTLEINIEKTLNPQRFFEGLIHEVVEAISGEGELEIPHPVIEALSGGITAFLRDNNFLKE
jgi:hypothetical protein